MNQLKVKVGPQYYQYSESAMAEITTLLNEYASKNVLILHGNTSWQQAKPFFEEILAQENLNFSLEQFHGECSYNEGKRIYHIIQELEIDFLIGVGGGKLCDLTKYAAHLSKINYGIVPTLASNCAPWAPVAVMYQDNGLSEGKTFYLNRQAAFMISDPALTITAPVNYLIAGIADTIAKWYESHLILEAPDKVAEPFLQMAWFSAKMCRDQIYQLSDEAIADAKKQQCSADYQQLSEIILGIAGLIGGFSDRFGRNNLAHALHDALSKYSFAVHDFLHGEKIAYCLCYQLAFEEQWQDLTTLKVFLKKLGLPTTLKELNISVWQELPLTEIIDFVYQQDKIHLLPMIITKEKLRDAFQSTEKFITE